jgi:Secretion system C-terminal sorting domain
MNRILTLLFVFFNSLVFCQQPTVEWAKTFGGIYSDIARGVVVTPENDYIVVGTALSENFDSTDGKGFADAWVMKLDKNGKQIWKKSFGGADDDVATTINQTADGGYLIGGETASNNGDVKENKGKFDAWLFKIDKNGTLLWEKTFGGSDDDYKGDAFETKNGNIILGIVSKSNDGDFVGINGKEDCWFLKLDKQGNVLWKKEFGGSDVDNTRSIKPIDDKTFVAVGHTESSDGNFSNIQGDFILKMDMDGNFIWVKSFTTLTGFETTLMGFEAVTILSDNTIAAVGYVYRTSKKVDVILIQCDTSGKELMKKAFGGNGFDSGQDVRALPDGGMIILGTNNSTDSIYKKNYDSSDMWLFRLDKSGNTKWDIFLGGSKAEFSGDFVIANDNSILVVGETESSDSIFNKNNGREDWAIIKVKYDIRNSIQNSGYTHNIKVFPNPTNNILSIQYDSDTDAHISLFDLNGRLMEVNSIKASISGVELDCSHLSAGAYILNINTKNKSVNRKIIIMK